MPRPSASMLRSRAFSIDQPRRDASTAEPSPWADASELDSSEVRGSLADVVDRASAQLAILRRVLDEAGRTSSDIRRHTREFDHRLQQGSRFVADIDQRIARAGTAAGALDKAAEALRSLESLIQQVRAAREGFEKNTNARFDAQRREFEAKLNGLQAEFDQRLAAQRDSFDRTLREHEERAQARLVAMRQQAETNLAEFEIRRADVPAATVPARTPNDASQQISDRFAAQAEARAALALDQAEERLRTLEAEAISIPGKLHADVEALCGQARAVLGFDPRIAIEDRHGSPAPGSLADAAARADIALRETNDALLRLAAMTRQADQTRVQLGEVEARAGIVAEDHSAQDAQLRATLNEGVQAAHELKAILVESVSATHATLAESSAATQRLVTLRDDIESLTASARYNISQAQQADTSLAGTIEAARAKVEVLERSMEQATHQAAALVAVAKDVAGLTERASSADPAQAAKEAARKTPRLKKAA